MTAPTATFRNAELIFRRARAARSRGLCSAAARSLSSVRPRCKISRGAGHNREHSPFLGFAKQMAHDVFLSYAAADQALAFAVVAGLEGQGIRCWVAPRDIIPAGSGYGQKSAVSARFGDKTRTTGKR